MAKKHSRERGCIAKTILSANLTEAISFAEKTALNFQKRYGIYKCEYCKYLHLTTDVLNKKGHKPLLYITFGPDFLERDRYYQYRICSLENEIKQLTKENESLKKIAKNFQESAKSRKDTEEDRRKENRIKQAQKRLFNRRSK